MKGSRVINTERGPSEDCGFSRTEGRHNIEILELLRLFPVVSIDFTDRLLVRGSVPEFRHYERGKSGETAWRFGDKPFRRASL